MTDAIAREGAGLAGWIAIGPNRVRFLRDGIAAFPAMLEAIAGARHEVLLEMYWIGADRIGHRFRDALVARARAGVRVRIVFDAIGSFETPMAFWTPLHEAGAEVLEFSPLSPFKRRFWLERAIHRDHRKLLVVDGDSGFAGGINLGERWAPPDSPSSGWRDDGIEVRGPAAAALRIAFYDVWRRGGRTGPVGALESEMTEVQDARVRVITNRIERNPNRAIRRAYVRALRRATTSVEISSAYFLPGPMFLRALRAASRRGVQVRLLVPEHGDVRLVALAMDSLYGRLLSDSVEVFAYRPRVLHSKTAIFDAQSTMMGSHNLDALSWRFNLECNVVVDSAHFANVARASFERDLLDARKLDLNAWRSRPRTLRMLAWVAALFRAFL